MSWSLRRNTLNPYKTGANAGFRVMCILVIGSHTTLIDKKGNIEDDKTSKIVGHNTGPFAGT